MNSLNMQDMGVTSRSVLRHCVAISKIEAIIIDSLSRQILRKIAIFRIYIAIHYDI